MPLLLSRTPVQGLSHADQELLGRAFVKSPFQALHNSCGFLWGGAKHSRWPRQSVSSQSTEPEHGMPSLQLQSMQLRINLSAHSIQETLQNAVRSDKSHKRNGSYMPLTSASTFQPQSLVSSSHHNVCSKMFEWYLILDIFHKHSTSGQVSPWEWRKNASSLSIFVATPCAGVPHWLASLLTLKRSI